MKKEKHMAVAIVFQVTDRAGNQIFQVLVWH